MRQETKEVQRTFPFTYWQRLTLLIASVLCFGVTALQAQPPTGYYDTVDATNSTALRQTLHDVIDDHTRFPYTDSTTDTWDILNLADEDPNNTGNIIDIYKNASYAKIPGGVGAYNREHSWPKSYGFPNDNTDNYPYTDAHHLFACDAGYNSSRSNKPFRLCDASCSENPTDFNDGRGGGTGIYPGNSNWTSGSFTQGIWETWDGRKGDVARAIFYMDIRYEGGTHSVTGVSEPDLIATDNESLIDQSNTGNNESVAYMGMLSVLLQWHAQDPPDSRELWRNEVVFSFQGNRNPFIDHPEWAECLFNSLCGTGDTTPPAAPTGLVAVAGTNSVDLMWNANSEADLAGYHVYRGTAGGGPYARITGAVEVNNFYTDSSVTGGTTYFYVVRAVDTSANESGNSNEASATPTGGGGGGPSGVLLSEVLYDVSSSDDGFEWVELYNSSASAVDLSSFCLANGGTSYTTSTVQLSGTIASGTTFVVGGPTSSSINSSPNFDQVINFNPDFQNAGSTGDGVALFDVSCSQVSGSTVPVDAVIYGPNNNSGLIDETGSTNAPEVGDASPGSSIERLDLAGAWQIQGNPTPNATPLPSPGQCSVDADCSDGLFCNGAEVCNAGTCEAGSAPVCDDGLFCNGTESCNEATDSCDAGNAPACDDGLFCNGAESCNETTDSCDAGVAPCDPGTETCDEVADFCDPIGAGPEGLLLSEVLYDVSSGDDGFEWVELYNSGASTVDLSGFCLGNGGTSYTASTVQLTGTIASGATFVVGGPSSSATNANPSFDQITNFNPDFQNSGSTGDGVALFDVPCAQVNGSTIPVDAVIYGPNNNNGLNDETGAANGPEVGDASAGSSIERISLAGAWQIQGNPTPNATSLPPASGCSVDADCDDGLFCNGTETCNAGVCEAGSVPVCDDGLFCNGTESCNEATDSCDAGAAPACDDGLFCNGTESCNESTDSCDAGSAPVCDDGLFCNGTESCNESTDSCDAGSAPVCDDGLFCNGTETCNEATDSCDAGAAPVCDDGLFCNGMETCNESTDSCDVGTDPCAGGETCNETADVCESASGPVLWMSFRSNTVVPGVGTVADEDIVSYDEATATWALEFDGSDVGLSSLEISGLAILPGGNLLLSFTAAGTVGGLSVDDSDIVRFTPTSMGSVTAGTFSVYFDGSDVGLTSNGEDVDGLTLDAGGNLVVSTTGGFSGNGASGADEDLFTFSGSLGATTSGSFTRLFDGSDMGLGGNGAEDIDAAAWTAAGGLLFSTVGNFSASGLAGADEDVVEFNGTFGSATAGTFSMRQDLTALGIGASEDVGSLHIVE